MIDIAASRIAKAKDRYQKNFNYLKRQVPNIYKFVSECREHPEISILETDGSVMLMNGGEPVYSESALELAIKEVNYFNSTFDDHVYAPLPENIKIHNLIVKGAFKNTVEQYSEVLSKTERKTLKPHSKDIVVFGVGLGYHVEILKNSVDFSNLTVIEKDIKTFVASLYAVDWEKILSSLKPHQSLTLIVKPKSDQKEVFENTIKQHCVNLFPSISISTIIYNHHPFSKEYKQEKYIIEEFVNHMRLSSERIGPELQRLFNATHNSKQNYKLLNISNSKLPNNKLIIICGAGPSLDKYSALLKKYRDDVIIISSGSTLSSLLNIGIKPDLHFELEFQNLATDLLEHVKESHSLDNLNLICTLEANPGYPRMFHEAYMFCPESSELHPIFSEENILRRGGITCTNGAAALACRLSDNPIYLIGLDFAYTFEQHHNLSNASQNLPEHLSRVTDPEFSQMKNLFVENTSGERVRTSIGLNSARLTLESLAKTVNNKFYNCSYGAKIEATEFLSESNFEKFLIELNEANSNVNSKESLVLKTNNLPKKDIKVRTENLIQRSLNNAKKVLDIFSANYKTRDDRSTLVKEIFYQLTELMRDMGQYRNTLSFVKYPLVQLYVVTNFLPISEQNKVIDCWIAEFDSYIKELEDLLITRIKQENYLITEDWVSTKENEDEK